MLKKYLPHEEIEDFAVWAFGDDWDFIDNGAQLAAAWNGHHDSSYRIEQLKDLSHDIEIMLDLWESFKASRWDNPYHIPDYGV
jgi:hypothetical protein